MCCRVLLIAADGAGDGSRIRSRCSGGMSFDSGHAHSEAVNQHRTKRCALMSVVPQSYWPPLSMSRCVSASTVPQVAAAAR